MFSENIVGRYLGAVMIHNLYLKYDMGFSNLVVELATVIQIKIFIHK